MQYVQRGLQSLWQLLLVGVVLTLGMVEVSAARDQVQLPARLPMDDPWRAFATVGAHQS